MWMNKNKKETKKYDTKYIINWKKKGFQLIMSPINRIKNVCFEQTKVLFLISFLSELFFKQYPLKT